MGLNYRLVKAMKNDKKKEKSKLDDELEEIFELTWKNWESRRKCEQTHVPEYIKREKKEKNHIK